MSRTFILQGSVMTKAFGFIDVASMNSLDAISVLVFGYLTASHIYPALAKRGIKLATTYKFAICSGLGALAMVWALIVEQIIHRAYQKDSRQISVLWHTIKAYC
jgi:dipeptide/tripeptide permease